MTDFFFWQDLRGFYCNEFDELWDTERSASSPSSQTAHGSTDEDVFLQALKEAKILVQRMLALLQTMQP